MRKFRSGEGAYRGRRGFGWKKLLLVVVLVLIAAFGVLEGIVRAGGRTQVSGSPDIMVVFGCQVKPWGPSILLQDRLDTALAYLEEYPDMTVVVSGGQGDDEHISEARCMRDYLVEHGVDPDHIYMEDVSHNTRENIRRTEALLSELFASGEVEPSGEYLLVSSDFHLARIKMLWGRFWPGTYTVSTLAAPCSHAPSRVKMFFREPLALVKSFVFDR